MKKEYIKPDIEEIELSVTNIITSDGVLSGGVGTGDEDDYWG